MEALLVALFTGLIIFIIIGVLASVYTKLTGKSFSDKTKSNSDELRDLMEEGKNIDN